MNVDPLDISCCAGGIDVENPQLDAVVESLISCYRSGGKLLVCGNGGSAADSAHIVGELVKGFRKKRPLPDEWKAVLGEAPLQQGLPAVDLTAQSALMTAVVNDIGGEYIFAQQVLAYGVPGDMLIGISTSGNARDVYLAVLAAKAKGVTTVGFTGQGGGKLREVCDLMVEAPEKETFRVQEEHIKLYHELCARVEDAFFDE